VNNAIYPLGCIFEEFTIQNASTHKLEIQAAQVVLRPSAEVVKHHHV
jgi:hypothetical protein